MYLSPSRPRVGFKQMLSSVTSLRLSLRVYPDDSERVMRSVWLPVQYGNETCS